MISVTDPDWSKIRFDAEKFVCLKSLIDPSVISTAYRYALMKTENDAMETDDQVPGAHSLYGDALMEALLDMTRPALERATGLELFPTYSYFRVYRNGDVLTPHTDRPSCEISATVTLGFKARSPWTIYMADGAIVTPVAQEPGDMVIYRGTELTHWRERFEGEHHAQVFLHYVDRNGPYAGYKYDGRPRLGMPAAARASGL